MSYGISVAFKKCKKEEIYDKLKEFKQLFTKRENAEKIISDNRFYFSNYVYMHEKQAEANIMRVVDGWVKQIFTYRFRYSETLQCLCFVLAKTDVEEINNWFDNFSYFQNSTDQDYDYEDWNGVPYFEEQVEKVKNLSAEGFKKLYISKHPYWDECDEEHFEDDDYNRRSLVYTLCYAEVEDLLGDKIAISLLSDFEELYDYRGYVRRLMLELDKRYDDDQFHKLFRVSEKE